jgi:hypothetical protein
VVPQAILRSLPTFGSWGVAESRYLSADELGSPRLIRLAAVASLADSTAAVLRIAPVKETMSQMGAGCKLEIWCDRLSTKE